jgi:hypothetical protein
LLAAASSTLEFRRAHVKCISAFGMTRSSTAYHSLDAEAAEHIQQTNVPKNRESDAISVARAPSL